MVRQLNSWRLNCKAIKFHLVFSVRVISAQKADKLFRSIDLWVEWCIISIHWCLSWPFCWAPSAVHFRFTAAPTEFFFSWPCCWLFCWAGWFTKWSYWVPKKSWISVVVTSWTWKHGTHSHTISIACNLGTPITQILIESLWSKFNKHTQNNEIGVRQKQLYLQGLGHTYLCIIERSNHSCNFFHIPISNVLIESLFP